MTLGQFTCLGQVCACPCHRGMMQGPCPYCRRGLGDVAVPMTRRQECVLEALSRLAWGFWSKAASGSTFAALEYLEVFRGLYNMEIDNLRPAIPAALAPRLPASLSAVQWDSPMISAIGYLVAVEFGRIGASSAISAVRAMPLNAGAVGAWFTNTLRPALPASAVAVLERYAGVSPDPETGSLVRPVALAAGVDLRACAPEVVASRVTPAQSAAAVATVPPSPEYEIVEAGGGDTPATPPPAEGSSGSGAMLAVGGVLLVGAALWLSRGSR